MVWLKKMFESALPAYRYNLQNRNYVRSTAYKSPLSSSVISPGYSPLNHPLDPFNLKFLLLIASESYTFHHS
jgi:hypothetical protein